MKNLDVLKKSWWTRFLPKKKVAESEIFLGRMVLNFGHAKREPGGTVEWLPDVRCLGKSTIQRLPLDRTLPGEWYYFALVDQTFFLPCHTYRLTTHSPSGSTDYVIWRARLDGGVKMNHAWGPDLGHCNPFLRHAPPALPQPSEKYFTYHTCRNISR
jgi:hypothetical protein